MRFLAIFAVLVVVAAGQELPADSPILTSPRPLADLLEIDRLSSNYLGRPCELEPGTLRCKPDLNSTAAAGSRDCVFLHGSGETETLPSTSTFPGYWGEVEKFTTQCRSRTFIHHDTVTFAWDNWKIMQDWCDVATGTPYGKTIRNTIVFTHSMGNLIMAGAFKVGACEIDTSTSSWYEIAGPMRGSLGANLVNRICSEPGNYSQILRDLAKLMNYCSAKNPNQTNAAYASMVTTYANLTGIVEVTSKRISGAMCGTSGFGLTSRYSPALSLLGSLAFPSNDPNDGMVDFASCDVRGNYGGDATDAFYKASINHVDSTCRIGNGVAGASRMPCNWFKYRT